MANVRVYIATSLDGYIAGPDDDLSWLPTEAGPGTDEALGFEAFMADVGAMLMGRRTYDVVRSLGEGWPYGETPVLVATHRELESDLPTVRAVSGSTDAVLDAALEEAGGRDVYLDGGAMVQAALEVGRVDELIVTLVPVLVGGGVPLFGTLRERQEFVFEEHTSMGSMVQLRARPKRGV
ncbi:MAG: dihydrofolate reductase family protein [Nannocystales bacterium]